MSEKHNSIYVPARDKLINWVRQQLTGEFLANREEKDAVIHDHPTEVFPCGALYPVDRGGVGIDPASKTNDIDVVKTDDASEDGSEDKSISRYSSPLISERNFIGFAEIKDYKGLESTVVIMVDFTKESIVTNYNSSYVGMTRAKTLLSIIYS